MNIPSDQLRKLAIALLDDDQGISEAAYDQLRPLLEEDGAIDIIEAVKATDGRYYLPDNTDVRP